MPVISIVVTCARRKDSLCPTYSPLRSQSSVVNLPQSLRDWCLVGWAYLEEQKQETTVGGNQYRYMPRTHRSRFTPTAQGPPWSSVADAAPVFNLIRLLEIVVPEIMLIWRRPASSLAVHSFVVVT
ncbi:hypothetical protein NEUTE2DRAFT_126012 [Neurospora tetrasperma FGSC 2509]|nr:hypothetical protein NEUTE2DRAFT_126012 [Neurospora tetrasperma FGSC 2509]